MNTVTPHVYSGLVARIHQWLRISIDVGALDDQPQRLMCRERRTRWPDLDVDGHDLAWLHFLLALVREYGLEFGAAAGIELAMGYA